MKSMKRYRTILDVFWKDGSPFYEKFKELNLENVIELACGWADMCLFMWINRKRLHW